MLLILGNEIKTNDLTFSKINHRQIIFLYLSKYTLDTLTFFD